VFLSILGGVALYYSYAQFMAYRTRKQLLKPSTRVSA
jgi:hypothetical protein